MNLPIWVPLLIIAVGIFLFVRKYSKKTSRLSEAEARDSLHKEGQEQKLVSLFENPVCDICSKSIVVTESYMLTTEQVASKEAYWEYAFTHSWSYFHGTDPKGSAIGNLARQQASQSTAWAVCESCSQLFQFDRKKANQYAKLGTSRIPGSGPADLNRVLIAAATVWKKLYGSYPDSIRFE